jgi:uncharacterized membrane protein YeaQ/YmgE (transglycosylase-associated protein family)
MMGFIWWLIIGLIAGALARLIMPGRDPMGIIATIVLGIVGSILGGLVSMAIWRNDPDTGFHPAGLLLSINRRHRRALDLPDGEEPKYRLSRFRI